MLIGFILVFVGALLIMRQEILENLFAVVMMGVIVGFFTLMPVLIYQEIFVAEDVIYSESMVPVPSKVMRHLCIIERLMRVLSWNM